MRARPDRKTPQRAERCRECDLAPLTLARERDAKGGRLAGFAAGALGWAGGLFILNNFLMGNVRFPATVILPIIALLIGSGIFFWGIILHQYLSPGYVRILIDHDSLTFVSKRESMTRRLGWSDRGFHLRLVRDEWMGSFTTALDYTDSWSPKGLTEEALNAILAEAEESKLVLERKKGWGGVRTYINIHAVAIPGG